MDLYNIDKDKGFLVSLKALIIQKNRLLVLKNKTGVFIKQSRWELPGGIVEINEEINKGLIREIREETGLEVSIGDIFAVWDHREKSFKLKDGRVLDMRIVEIAFFCQKISGEIKLSDEHCRFKWATRTELEKLNFALNSKTAIKKYLKQKPV